MKQIIQNYRTGKLEIKEVPPPMLRKGGAIVRALFSLISPGTERATMEISKKSLLGKARARPDLVRQVISTAKRVGVKKTIEIVMDRLNTPVPLGYSLSGIVEELSSEVTGVGVGDLVACAGAGYASHAEVVFVPINLLVKVPEGVSEEEAAFTTLGSIALHGVRQANLSIGDRVGVIGLGLVGQITVALLKLHGCQVLGVDLREYAVEASQKMGIDLGLLRNLPGFHEKVREFSGGKGLDAVIITASSHSNDPFELASELLRDRGTLVIVGGIKMEIEKSISSLFYQKEIEIKFSRSYGPGRYDPNYEEKGIDYPIGYVRWTEKRNMECFLEIVSSRKIDLSTLITHVFPFDQAIEAYKLISSQEPFLGVLLKYQEKKEKEKITPTLILKATPLSGKIGVGVLGAGHFAQSNLLPYLKKISDVELVGLCTSRGIMSQSVGEKFGFAYCTQDPHQILNDERIKVVFIATRHDSHGKYVIEALKRKKHVFVEKPLTLDEEELREIIHAYELSRHEQALHLMVGYNRRFAPLSLKLRSVFEEINSPLLIIYRVNAGYLSPESWYQDPAQGGRLVGECCHFIDFAQFLSCSYPIRVVSYGILDKDKPSFLCDNLIILIQMKNDSLASILYTSMGDPSLPKERIEVFAGASSAILDDFKSLLCYREGKKKKYRQIPQDKGHRAEIEIFVRAIKQGDASPIEFETLVKTSRTTFAALESLKSRKPVEL